MVILRNMDHARDDDDDDNDNNHNINHEYTLQKCSDIRQFRALHKEKHRGLSGSFLSGIFKSRSLQWTGHAARTEIQEKHGNLRRRNILENVHVEDQEYGDFSTRGY